MNFDLRFPIGLLFSFYGLVLVVYGAISNSDKAMYAKSLDININVIWGIVMLVFGGAMLGLAMRARKKSK